MPLPLALNPIQHLNLYPNDPADVCHGEIAYWREARRVAAERAAPIRVQVKALDEKKWAAEAQLKAVRPGSREAVAAQAELDGITWDLGQLGGVTGIEPYFDRERNGKAQYERLCADYTRILGELQGKVPLGQLDQFERTRLCGLLSVLAGEVELYTPKRA